MIIFLSLAVTKNGVQIAYPRRKFSTISCDLFLSTCVPNYNPYHDFMETGNIPSTKKINFFFLKINVLSQRWKRMLKRKDKEVEERTVRQRAVVTHRTRKGQTKHNNIIKIMLRSTTCRLRPFSWSWSIKSSSLSCSGVLWWSFCMLIDPPIIRIMSIHSTCCSIYKFLLHYYNINISMYVWTNCATD